MKADYLDRNLDRVPTSEPTPEKAGEPAAKTTLKVETEATPTKRKKLKLKSQEEFMNEIIADKKDIKTEIFLNYFKYHNPSFLVQDLITAKQNNNEKLVNNINSPLIDLRNDISRKEMKVRKK